MTTKAIEKSLHHAVISVFTDTNSNSATVYYAIGEIVEDKFVPLCTESVYVAPEDAVKVRDAAITKDDLGKLPEEVVRDRFFNYLVEIGKIKA